MTEPLAQVQDRIVHLYYTEFIKDHFGLLRRPDVCIALEYQVWLETFHPALTEFGESSLDTFNTIRDWISHPQLEYQELVDYFSRLRRDP